MNTPIHIHIRFKNNNINHFIFKESFKELFQEVSDFMLIKRSIKGFALKFDVGGGGAVLLERNLDEL